MALKYTTTQQLGEVLRIVREVPNWDIAGTPTNEAVGTGTGSATSFYLDQKNIISGSYTLYANAVAMTETTHYTLDKPTGEITLTGAGVTLLSTNALTAKYKYFDLGWSDSYLEDVLERAEKKVDNEVNTIFTDGTATNPSYTSTTEIQPSSGYFNNQIIVDKKPLIDVETTLDGDHAVDVTTISLLSGATVDYPTSGNIIVGSEVITYTGISTNDLTGCTRGALSSTATVHSDGDAVHSTILFLSNTSEGTSVTWTPQEWDINMHASEEGLIYSFDESVFTDTQYPDRLVKPDVANRVKIIYYYGYNSIPADIVRLTLIFAKQMLTSDTISKSLIAGRDEFRPEMMNADYGEIESIINSYIIIPMGNT